MSTFLRFAAPRKDRGGRRQDANVIGHERLPQGVLCVNRDGKQGMNVSRQSFLKGFAAGAACLALPSPRTFAASKARGASYSAAVLGDTHYDGATVATFHPGDNPKSTYGSTHYEEFLRDIEMWHTSGRCPSLVAAGAALAENSPTSFVLQLGDLVQGDCQNAEMHKQMLDAGIAALRGGGGRFRPELPLLTVLGNHDERDYKRRDVARTAYYEWAGPYMRNEIAALTGTALDSDPQYPVFSFRYGGDLWVFCKLGQSGDSTSSWCTAVKSAIEADVSARHVFLVTHGPFTPSATTNYPHWRLGGDSSTGVSQQGKALYETLSRRHAVVISGHTHTTNWYWHENEHGGFAEMTVNSVWSSEGLATAVPAHNSPEDYDAPSNANQAYIKAMDFFRPGLKKYFYNAGAGHYRLNVSDDGVTMAFYPGASLTPARVFVLKRGGGANGVRGIGWVNEAALTTQATGSWSKSVQYDAGTRRATLPGDCTFTFDSPSPRGRSATMTVRMRFRRMTVDVAVPDGAQAAVQIGTNGRFQLWTLDGGDRKWLDAEADGVEPEHGVYYTFRFKMDYGTRRYTASVRDSSGNFRPLAAQGGQTSFALTSDADHLESVRFKGGGMVESLLGRLADGTCMSIR